MPALPKPLVCNLMQVLLPEKKLWGAFRSGQARSSKYLQPGDGMTLTIACADRVVDLVEQRPTVFWPEASPRQTREKQPPTSRLSLTHKQPAPRAHQRAAEHVQLPGPIERDHAQRSNAF